MYLIMKESPMDISAPAPTSAISAQLRNLVWILVIGGIAPALDTTIVNVALPTLGHALNTTVSTSQWTITGYLLAMAIALPASGWLTDHIGGKTLWLITLTLFVLGSALAGLSWTITSLIVFRIIQGAAAGVLTPLLTTLLLRMAKGTSLGSLMSIATLPAVVVPVLGPVVGGLIIGSLDWRWIFYVNVPICIIAIILAWWKLPADEPLQKRYSFDILGLIVLSPALALLVYGLSQASGTLGFGARAAYIPLAIGLALTVTFVVYALLKRSRPLINLRMLRVRSYALSLCILFFAGLSVYGPLLLISLYYQQLQGYSALITGLLLGAQGIGSLIPRVTTGKLTDRFGPRPIILIGLVITVLGTLPFAFATASTSGWILVVALFVRGVGLTPVNIAVMVGAFQGVPREELPDGSSTIRIIQQVGGAFGATVLVLILGHAALTVGIPSQAFNVAFWWSIGFVALAFIPAIFLPVIFLSKVAGARKEAA
jgi:EmrB/QacA subfamily drug resistance transporter